MSREIEKQEILNLVKKYARNHLSNINNNSFSVGDKIPYSEKVFDENEVVNLVDSALDFWLTQGKYYDEFEDKLSKYLNIKYVSLVNSGSSANLLAFMALTSPLLKERRLNKGDEVITVACGFPTTISPIVNFGAVPVFVDIDIPTYNIDVNDLEKALSNKTKAVFLAHTLGNPFDIIKVKEFCDKHSLWLIEDNCDALGAEVNIDGVYKKTGTIGDIGTSSFYPPHHITMGEGGAVYTNNPILHKIVQSMRDWGRDCICKSGVDNTCGKRFTGQYGELPFGYDHKYVYSHFGYNLKATDLQAAIGVKQLDKINDFVKKRRENFDIMTNELIKNGLQKYFILPKATDNTKPSWFSYILTIKDEAKENGLIRKKIVDYLDSKKIHTRYVFAGNMIKQPVYSNANKNNYRVIGDLKNTDKVMNDTFMVGVYPLINKEKIDYIVKSLVEIVNG